jgi:hypothetical protein
MGLRDVGETQTRAGAGCKLGPWASLYLAFDDHRGLEALPLWKLIEISALRRCFRVIITVGAGPRCILNEPR